MNNTHMNTRKTLINHIVKVALALNTLAWFALAPQMAFADLPITIIAHFNSANGTYPYGAYPYAGVTLDSENNIFGTTATGTGAASNGTIYEITQGSGIISNIALFNSASGTSPESRVTIDDNGNIFGTTYYNGANGDGTVYEIAKGNQTATAIASFDGVNGANPKNGVSIDSNGNIFGTSYAGGANSDGTVYEIAKGSKTVTALTSFSAIDAWSGITLDSSGNLFGTTQLGGANGDGVVYEIAHGSSTVKIIASFDGIHGANPESGVTLDSKGDIFGDTFHGGLNYGTVYEIANGSNAITTLASFDGINEINPYGGVTLDSNGDIFGTYSGRSNNGAVYEIAHGSQTITTLATFNGSNGNRPNGGVALDSSGNIFGTTEYGTGTDVGSVYEIAGAATPVPETSSALSLGLLLMLGTGGLFWRTRRADK